MRLTKYFALRRNHYLIEIHAMKKYSGVEAQLHVFLTFALDGNEWYFVQSSDGYPHGIFCWILRALQVNIEIVRIH
jgi:hypothetical protein